MKRTYGGILATLMLSAVPVALGAAQESTAERLDRLFDEARTAIAALEDSIGIVSPGAAPPELTPIELSGPATAVAQTCPYKVPEMLDRLVAVESSFDEASDQVRYINARLSVARQTANDSENIYDCGQELNRNLEGLSADLRDVPVRAWIRETDLIIACADEKEVEATARIARARSAENRQATEQLNTIRTTIVKIRSRTLGMQQQVAALEDKHGRLREEISELTESCRERGEGGLLDF